jgi:hypothetical protein
MSLSNQDTKEAGTTKVMAEDFPILAAAARAQAPSKQAVPAHPIQVGAGGAAGPTTSTSLKAGLKPVSGESAARPSAYQQPSAFPPFNPSPILGAGSAAPATPAAGAMAERYAAADAAPRSPNVLLASNVLLSPVATVLAGRTPSKRRGSPGDEPSDDEDSGEEEAAAGPIRGSSGSKRTDAWGASLNRPIILKNREGFSMWKIEIEQQVLLAELGHCMELPLPDKIRDEGKRLGVKQYMSLPPTSMGGSKHTVREHLAVCSYITRGLNTVQSSDVVLAGKLRMLKPAGDGHELWKLLQAHYEDTREARLGPLSQQYYNTTPLPNEGPESLFFRMETVRGRINSISGKDQIINDMTAKQMYINRLLAMDKIFYQNVLGREMYAASGTTITEIKDLAVSAELQLRGAASSSSGSSRMQRNTEGAHFTNTSRPSSGDKRNSAGPTPAPASSATSPAT